MQEHSNTHISTLYVDVRMYGSVLLSSVLMFLSQERMGIIQENIGSYFTTQFQQLPLYRELHNTQTVSLM